MGSDLYRVELRSSLNLTRQEAIERCLIRGFPRRALDDFFVEDRWRELELETETIHPDASAGFDPCFVLRIIDEGVVKANRARSPEERSAAIDFDATPLIQHYGGREDMWGMDFQMTDERPSVAWIAEAEYRHGRPPGLLDAGCGDSSRVVALIPERFAPGLDRPFGWESRAWQGRDFRRFEHADDRAPRRSELRLLDHARALPELDAALQDIAFLADGRLALLSRGRLQLIDLRDPGASAIAPTPIRGGRCLAVDDGGRLWVGGQALELRGPSGELLRRWDQDQGLRGPIARLCPHRSGGLIGADDRGFFSVSAEGVLELDDTACFLPRLARAGAKVIAACSSFACLPGEARPSVFTEREGYPAYKIEGLAPLADGSALFCEDHWLWLLERDGFRVRLALDLKAHAPEGLVAGVCDAEGRSWLLTRAGHILVLEGDRRPCTFAWRQPAPEGGFQRIALSPGGDLAIAGRRGGVFLPAEQRAAAMARPPDNRALLEPRPLEPFRYPRDRQPPTMDWRGKRVAISGRLVSMTRARARAFLAERGSALVAAASVDTDAVVLGIKPGANWTKALELGCRILPEESLALEVSRGS